MSDKEMAMREMENQIYSKSSENFSQLSLKKR